MVDFDKAADGPPPHPARPPAYPASGYPPPGHPPPGYPSTGLPAQGVPPPGYHPGYGPPPVGYGPPHQMPSSNIGWAIGALLLFWPLAIPAFIYSSRVENLWFAGNVHGAQKASADARTYGLIGVIIGAVGWVIAVVFFLIFFVFVANTIHEINNQLPTFSPPASFPS